MPTTSIDDIEVDFKRAEEARRSGNFKRAFAGYLTILTSRIRVVGEPSNLTAADMVVLERAAELATLFGYDKGADDLLAGMASLLESAQNFFGADYATVKRIHLALSFGRLTNASQLLRGMSSRIGDIEAHSLTDTDLDAWETRCHWNDTTAEDRAVMFSRLYLIFGWLLSSLGQYQAALLMLQRGLRFTGQSAPKLAQRAALPLNLAIVTALLESGDLNAARENLERIESTLDRKRQPGSYVRASELDAKLRMLRGDFGGALTKYLDVLQCCEEGEFQRSALVAKLNLADALTFLNNVAVAQEIVLSVKAQAAELGDDYVTARATRQLAVAEERSSSFVGTTAVASSDSTFKTSPSASAVAETFPEIPQSENYLSLFEDRTLDFYWQLGQLNLPMASVVVDHLRDAFGKSDSKLILLRLKILEGTLAYYNGDLERAERLLGESLPVLAEMDLKPELLQAQRILSWCWIRLGRPKSSSEQLSENNKQLLTSMTESLPPAYQSVYLLNKWTTEEEFIAGEIGRLVELKEKMNGGIWINKPLRRWSLMKRIYGLLEYIERYRDSLIGDVPEEREAAQKKTSLWKLLWNHPRDRATISFLVLPDRVLIIYAGWMCLDFKVAKIGKIQIREIVKQWHVLVNRSAPSRNVTSLPTDDLLGIEFLDSLFTGERNLNPLQSSGKADPSNDATLIAEKVAHRLQLPSIIKLLSPRVRTLTIIPHDSLVGFPFAAIRYEGSYLLERFGLNVDVGFFSQKNGARVVTGPKALFVGVQKGGANFQALPGVLPEIHELEKWCQKRNLPYQTLLDEVATKSAIVKHLNDSTLLHIACHGIFRADQPDASGLVLVSENGRVEVLSVRELSALNLTQLRHVSLSACSSADNFIVPGRWIIGLPETFRRVGTESILACLWTVNDQFAKSFAARFYEYLNTCSRDQALRRTQLDCLKKGHSDGHLRPLEKVGDIDTTHPFHWATYILCGNHRRLQW